MKTNKVIMSQIPQVLSQIERQIRRPGIITQEKYNKIHKELDIVLATLAQGNSPTILPLKDRIVTLCGELENRLEQDQLQAIQKTADQLAQMMQNYQESHLPSLADKKILAQANHLLSATHSQIHNRFEMRASAETQEKDPEDSFALLEMARAVYNREIGAARKIYLSLPESLQNEFSNHMKILMATPLEDTKETLQALTLMSGALPVTSGYPSSEQIELFFLGIPDEEPVSRSSDGKIIPFDTKR